MKKFLFLLLIVIAIVISCKNEKKTKTDCLQKAITNLNSLTISKEYSFEDLEIQEILSDLNLAQKENQKWEYGYIQEIRLYVFLYIFSSTDLKKHEAIERIGTVFNKYFEKNLMTDDVKFLYAVYQYLNNNKFESTKLFKELYIKSYEYDFENIPVSDAKNFIMGILLSDIEIETFMGTNYEIIYNDMLNNEYFFIELLQYSF